MPTSAAGCARIAGVLGALALSAGCAPAIDAIDIEAAQTTAQVVTAIVNDPEIGTRTIDVRVSQGVVHLSGRVRSQDEATRAIELARSVPGVTRVDSRLAIGADAPPPDDPPPTVRARAVHDPAAEFAELDTTPRLFAIGASLGWSEPGHGQLDSGVSVGPIVRLGSGAGFGPALALDWFRTEVAGSPDRPLPASRLRRQLFELGVPVGAAHRRQRLCHRHRAVDAHAGIAGALRRRGADSGRARHRAGARDRPAHGGLLLAGRIGAGIGAELGAMKVTEQIDALEASAVDSFKYLVVTRVVACVIALPLLTSLMNFTGMLGGFAAETSITGIPLRAY
jgi:hypothetical protein